MRSHCEDARDPDILQNTINNRLNDLRELITRLATLIPHEE
jgi:hypothetical protein